MSTEPEATTQILDPGTAWDMADMERRYRSAQANVRAVADRHLKAERELEAFKRDLCEKALDYADEYGLCNKVEAFLTDKMDLGEYLQRDVDVEVTFTVTVKTIGRNEPDHDDVAEAAAEYLRYQFGETDWQV